MQDFPLWTNPQGQIYFYRLPQVPYQRSVETPGVTQLRPLRLKDRPVMADTSLLVEYENIQALDLSTIPANARVVLVLGAKQSKLPTELAMQGQLLGDRFAYVRINVPQPNGVDFCIAFYLGEYLARDPDADCVILSRDKKGFDPPVQHVGFLGTQAAIRAYDDAAEMVGEPHWRGVSGRVAVQALI